MTTTNRPRRPRARAESVDDVRRRVRARARALARPREEAEAEARTDDDDDDDDDDEDVAREARRARERLLADAERTKREMEAVEAALEDVDPTTDALRAAVGKKRLEGLRGKMETRARARRTRDDAPNARRLRKRRGGGYETRRCRR